MDQLRTRLIEAKEWFRESELFAKLSDIVEQAALGYVGHDTATKRIVEYLLEIPTECSKEDILVDEVTKTFPNIIKRLSE